ncbi:MAG: ribosome-binding factor A [Spirochaetes bacterium GWF1_41_5]|nr:MAG: ribosome-binding factor A [Spirochaetes bacterium GWF1_41_5]HBE01450.1 30S ribosome-binding factor RbfA [Spirochaetia bacterium]
MNSSLRRQRLNRLICIEISKLLQKDLKDPRFDGEFITITRAEIKDDQKNADVFFTVLDHKKKKKIAEAFNSASAFIMRRLADVIKIRYIPVLHFFYDHDLKEADRIVDIINKEAKG